VSLRLYRTAGGLRALATDRDFEPLAAETHAEWLKRYERPIEIRATCRYLETVGTGAITPHAKARVGGTVELHGRAT